MKTSKLQYGGFTLIEVMISTALFTIIMVIGTGAILGSNTVHKKSQNQRAILDNLNFIMEDMARNIKLGEKYHCMQSGDTFENAGNIQTTPAPVDGDPCPGIAFVSVDGATTTVYKMVTAGQKTKFQKIKGSDGPNADFIDMTPPEVEIIPTQSGFSIYGAPSTDVIQPRVVIRLAGRIVYKNDLVTPFNLQTTVSQRLIDLP